MVSPQDLGLWDPLQMAVSWLINGGDPGMILQVNPASAGILFFLVVEGGKYDEGLFTLGRGCNMMKYMVVFVLKENKTLYDPWDDGISTYINHMVYASLSLQIVETIDPGHYKLYKPLKRPSPKKPGFPFDYWDPISWKDGK